MADLGQVFTNRQTANHMAALFSVSKDAALLDPCFGKGAFLEALSAHGYTNVEGYELDPALFCVVQKKFPRLCLHQGDFLQAGGKKYDGIIMNPPYLRQEKIDDLKAYGITKDQLRKDALYKSLPRSANLYMYFVLKALDLLKPNGELVIIFPISWTNARTGREFETQLRQKCTIESQIRIKDPAFETDVLVEVVILKLKKKPPQLLCTPEPDQEAACRSLGFSTPFSSLGTVCRGLTTGCNELYINPPLKEAASEPYLRPIISTPKAIYGFTTAHAKADRLLLPQALHSNVAEIEQYLNAWQARILQSKKPKTLYEKLQKGDPWFGVKPVESSGIWFSYFIRSSIKFVYNSEHYLARDNFYIIRPKIDIFLAFALLNSYYTFYQLEQRGKFYGAGLLKLQRYDLQALLFPLDVLSPQEQEALRQAAQKLMQNDVSQIEQITRILSCHSNLGYAELMEQYRALKRHRLGE